jgi:hypothetical protein
VSKQQLDLIEAHLQGRAKVKVWDCSRKDIFRELTPSQFKLWFYLWTQENDKQESYQSLKTMEKGTSMSRHTVIEAKKLLLASGWLVAPGGTAADKYTTATPGASKVLIYRVDDPISGGRAICSHGAPSSEGSAESATVGSAEFAPSTSAEIAPAHSAEFAPTPQGTGAIFAPKVSGSGSGSGLDSGLDSGSATAYGYRPHVAKPSLPSGELPPSAEEEKPKPKPKTKTKNQNQHQTPLACSKVCNLLTEEEARSGRDSLPSAV